MAELAEAAATSPASVYRVSLLRVNGVASSLPPLQPLDTVRDLARCIRAVLGIPISVQQLAWESHFLKNSSETLQAIFGELEDVEITVLRRPLLPTEKAELYKRLVRATAAGKAAEVRELLKEGAQVKFEPHNEDTDEPVCLGRWEDNPQEDSDSLPGAADSPEGVGIVGAQQRREHLQEVVPEEETSHPNSEDEELEEQADELANPSTTAELADPCGGISPLLAALATRQEELAEVFRELGAQEVDLEPKAAAGLKEAMCRSDFPDVVRHVLGGADVDTRLGRGRGMLWALDVWAIWHGQEPNFATPLHACAAMHNRPGAYETAQLLIHARADLNAGDAEGDTPLAHARYFRALDFFSLYKGQGAKLGGPFYGRFER